MTVYFTSIGDLFKKDREFLFVLMKSIESYLLADSACEKDFARSLFFSRQREKEYEAFQLKKASLIRERKEQEQRMVFARNQAAIRHKRLCALFYLYHLKIVHELSDQKIADFFNVSNTRAHKIVGESFQVVQHWYEKGGGKITEPHYAVRSSPLNKSYKMIYDVICLSLELKAHPFHHFFENPIIQEYWKNPYD